jgi:methyl-accepting chemotaxis protein
MKATQTRSTGSVRLSFFRSIASKYLMWLIPSIVLLFGGFGFFLYQAEKARELEKHVEMAQIIADKTNQALIQWIDAQIRLAQSIAVDVRVQSLCKSPLDPETRRQAQAYLSEIHRYVPYCENIPVAIHLPTNTFFELPTALGAKKIGNGNFIIDTVGEKTIGKCGPQFSYIQKVFGGSDYFISEVYPSILRGNPIFVVAAPIREQTNILGAVIVAPRMDYFTDFFLKEARIGKSGYLIMLDERGLVISHPRKDWILKDDAKRVLEPIMAHIRAGQTQFELVFDGKRKVYTVAKFSSERFNILHTWYIVSTREYDEIVAEVDDQFRWLALCMALVGGLVIILLMALTARLVSRPLAGLTQAAQRVAGGDLKSGMVLSRRQDEIGVLTQAFSRMTESLQEQTRLIRESVDMLEQSAGRINDICRTQEQTIQENKATTSEVAASVNQISATSRELAGTMQNVRELSSATETNADAGHASLARLSDTMQRLMQVTGGMSRRLVTINERALNISSVITAITKVADQTNLLSLNAGIEAEKAGEYGVGFAVVAREIRRLADQTAIAALDIERIIHEMQGAVETGVKEMDVFVEEVKAGAQVAGEAGQQLSATIEQVKAMAPRFEQVNNGMHEQSRGAAEINEAMRQISDKAVETTEGLAEIKGATEALRRAAAELQKQVARFSV